MKLKTTLDGFSPTFLRRMVAWCCRSVDYPIRQVRSAEFRNRTTRAYSGHAYSGRYIIASVGPASRFPLGPDSRPGMDNEVLSDRLEALIVITAHELAHLHQYAVPGRSRLLKQQRNTEHDARWHSIQALRAFRANRDALVAEWSAEPVKVERPKPSKQQANCDKAADALDRWQRKLKLAQTKCKLYRGKVRRYERIGIAATSSR